MPRNADETNQRANLDAINTPNSEWLAANPAYRLNGNWQTPMQGDDQAALSSYTYALGGTGSDGLAGRSQYGTSSIQIQAGTALSTESIRLSKESKSESASASASATTETIKPKQQQPRLTNEKEEDSIQSNVLDEYSNYTYHFRLYLAREEAVIAKNVTAEDIRVLAESGSGEMGITSVNIESIIGITRETGTGTSWKFDMVLQEPLGATFLDKISAYATEFGIKNFRAFPYFLELSFRARNPDEGGDFKPITDGTLSNQVWTWPIYILQTAINISGGGSTYDISGIIAGDKASSNHASDLSEVSALPAATVGEYFSNLEKYLYARQLEKSFSSKQLYPDEYKFIIDSDVAKEKIIPDNLEDTPGRSNTFIVEDGKTIATFSKGTSIAKIIDTVLCTTTYFQEAASAVDDADSIGQPGQTSKVQNQKLWKVITDVEIIQYDERRGDYQLRYKYLIVPYGKPTLKSKSNDSSELTANQRVSDLLQKQVLRKRYDYIYTGLNDQVLDFDITFNFQWYSVLPYQGGTNNSTNYEGGAQIDAQLLDSKKAATVSGSNSPEGTNIFVTADNPWSLSGTTNTATDVSAAAVDFTQLNYSATTDSTDQAFNIDASSAVLGSSNALTQGIDTWASTHFVDLGAQVSAAVGITQDSELYLGGQSSESSKVHGEQSPLGYQMFTEAKPGEGNAISLGNISNTGRSILSALMEDAMSPVSADLFNIELKVKGDPYWIEPAPLGKKYQFNSPMDRVLESRNPIDGTYDSGAIGTVDTADQEIFVLFRSFSPQMPDAETGLTPKFTTNTVLNGVYGVQKVTHEFAEGQFTQTINAIRFPHINLRYLDGDLAGLNPTLIDTSNEGT
jgi:hypothetical protein